MMNYTQAPPAEPVLLLIGFFLVLCAIGFLAMAERYHASQRGDEHGIPLPLPGVDEDEASSVASSVAYTSMDVTTAAPWGQGINNSRFAASLPTLPSRPACREQRIATSDSDSALLVERRDRVQSSQSFLASVSGQWVPPPEPDVGSKLSFKNAILVTLAGSACACVWSPLATFGMRGQNNIEANPYVCLFVFATGQLCALPSVALIAGRIGGTGMFLPCRQLTRPSVGWGVVCGLSVSSGYLAFFLGSQAAAPTVVFGIAHCSPLVSLLVEVFWVGSFNDAIPKVKLCLALCAVFYCIAIGFLMLSNS